MAASGHDSLGARRELRVGDLSYDYFSLERAAAQLGDASRLPYSLKVLFENLLRHENGRSVTVDHLQALVQWLRARRSEQEIAYRPARVLMQDFTGVPAVVDLAAMRQAMLDLGGDPQRINPLSPVDLVIDHSVQVDAFGGPRAFQINVEREYERNGERYAFLRWGAAAFDNFRVVPPGTGICHQVNLEYLAQVVWTAPDGNRQLAYPDTLVGTDSHTTMVNGLAVLGWGVGGIEAEAAMLGQPISMVIPEVVGFKLTGRLPEGATATDLVLTVTEMLRKKGVVGKFVEFYGDGLDRLPLADRATIGNMAPEYGATCGIFPIDRLTLEYLRLTGRSPERIALVEAYAKAQGLWRDSGTPDPIFSDTLALDLGTVEPSLAGPKRPQDRVALSRAKAAFDEALPTMLAKDCQRPMRSVPVQGMERELTHGDVVIAAITSCTNTSNPSVMLGAGLLARNARARGLKPAPHVKTSLAPGSKVVTDYLREAGLMDDLEALGFDLVGYGCTTCIGNSGPLPEPDRQGCGRRQSRGRRGAVGQPQLRGPHPPAGEGELSRLAAAGGRLRARRLGAQGPGERAARSGPERPGRLSARHLAEPQGGRGRGAASGVRSHVPRSLRRRVQGRRAVGADRRGRRPHLRLGRSQHLRAPAAVLRRHGKRASRPRGHQGCAHPGRCSAIPSPPTTSRPRARSPRTARPAAT